MSQVFERFLVSHSGAICCRNSADSTEYEADNVPVKRGRVRDRKLLGPYLLIINPSDIQCFKMKAIKNKDLPVAHLNGYKVFASLDLLLANATHLQVLRFFGRTRGGGAPPPPPLPHLRFF